jgi:hypothetical protein
MFQEGNKTAGISCQGIVNIYAGKPSLRLRTSYIASHFP